MTPLEYHLRNFVGIYWKMKAEVDYYFSEELPDTSGKALDEIVGAIAELMQEVSEHTKSDKRKVSAHLKSQKQVVELAWNGQPLESWHLKYINDRYQAGMNSDKNTFAGGAFSAAYRIGKWGGTVVIENYKNPIYVSRNVITIPLLLAERVAGA